MCQSKGEERALKLGEDKDIRDRGRNEVKQAGVMTFKEESGGRSMTNIM